MPVGCVSSDGLASCLECCLALLCKFPVFPGIGSRLMTILLPVLHAYMNMVSGLFEQVPSFFFFQHSFLFKY